MIYDIYIWMKYGWIWIWLKCSISPSHLISPHLILSHPISSNPIVQSATSLRPPAAAAPECPTTQPGRLRPSASSSSPPGAKKHHRVGKNDVNLEKILWKSYVKVGFMGKIIHGTI